MTIDRLNEDDRHDAPPLDLALVERAQESEFAGRWVRLELDDGLWFEADVAFGAKPEFQKALDVEEDRFRKERGISPRKELSKLQSDEIFFRAAFGRVIKGWRHIAYNGSPVDFTIENLLRICLPGRVATADCPGYLYRVRGALMNAITQTTRLAAEAESDVLGNWQQPSAGGSGGDGSETTSEKRSSPDSESD